MAQLNLLIQIIPCSSFSIMLSRSILTVKIKTMTFYHISHKTFSNKQIVKIMDFKWKKNAAERKYQEIAQNVFCNLQINRNQISKDFSKKLSQEFKIVKCWKSRKISLKLPLLEQTFVTYITS